MPKAEVLLWMNHRGRLALRYVPRSEDVQQRILTDDNSAGIKFHRGGTLRVAAPAIPRLRSGLLAFLLMTIR